MTTHERPIVIQVQSGGEELSTQAFDKERIVIGRGTDADVLLDNPGVSREHAVIHRRNGSVRIADLMSSNGTDLNGAPITEDELRDGDTIRISKFDLTVSFAQIDDDTGTDRLTPPPDPTIRVDD